MTRLLFDTTFLIDAERSGDDLDDVIADDDDVAVAAVTIAELRVGVLLADGPDVPHFSMTFWAPTLAGAQEGRRVGAGVAA